MMWAQKKQNGDDDTAFINTPLKSKVRIIDDRTDIIKF